MEQSLLCVMPGNLNCQRVEELLGDFVEGELPVQEVDNMREHIRQCTWCSQLLDDYLTIVRLAPTLVAPIPPGVHARLMAALQREAEKDKKIPPLHLVEVDEGLE